MPGGLAEVGAVGRSMPCRLAGANVVKPRVVHRLAGGVRRFQGAGVGRSCPGAKVKGVGVKHGVNRKRAGLLLLKH